MRQLIPVLALATAVACGGDSKPPTTSSAGVTYKLQTINGSPLPYTVTVFGPDKVEYLDDQVTLTDGGNYAESGHIRTTQNGQATTDVITDAGLFVRNGEALSFQSAVDGSTATGTLSGTTLTVLTPGLSSVYTKQ